MTTESSQSPLSASRVALAWLIAIGVDLFFNAGLFTPLWDQEREPALLGDDLLFRRIPFGYLVVGLMVLALAWVLNRTGDSGVTAARTGAVVGLVFGVFALVGLWTALDITGWFVAAGVLVFTVECVAGSLVLTSSRSGRSLATRVLGAFVVLLVAGQVIANLMG